MGDWEKVRENEAINRVDEIERESEGERKRGREGERKRDRA